jgi:hypothetical protein
LGRVTPGKVILGLLLVALVVFVKFGIPDTPSPPHSSAGSFTSPTTSPLTPLQEKVKEATAYWEEEKRAEAAWPERVRKAEVGVLTTIVGPGTSWPCASSKVALKELMKWQKAMLDEQAPDSVMSDLTDTLIRTRSMMVAPRERVKILEKEPGIRKVSVLGHQGTYGAAYMTTTAQGCWVASEAVTR